MSKVLEAADSGQVLLEHALKSGQPPRSAAQGRPSLRGSEAPCGRPEASAQRPGRRLIAFGEGVEGLNIQDAHVLAVREGDDACGHEGAEATAEGGL